ncbi:MAG TPA: hypothetical protein VGZ22_23200 [Isosphaeraceae bacterium]|jgi:hypothetical protein|nr:hypothetical protein [Isosphaeraceae bacterium]
MDIEARRARVYTRMAVTSLSVCFLGAILILAVVSIRLPALATTKKDVLFGTLLALGVSMLLVTNGLLLNLTIIIRQSLRRPAVESKP